MREQLNALEQRIEELDCGPSEAATLLTPEPAPRRAGVSALVDDRRDEVIVLTDRPKGAGPAVRASAELCTEGLPSTSEVGAARGGRGGVHSALGFEVDEGKSEVPSTHSVWPADSTVEAARQPCGSSSRASEPRADMAAAMETPLPGEGTSAKDPAVVVRGLIRAMTPANRRCVRHASRSIVMAPQAHVPSSTCSEIEALRHESAALKKQIRQIKDVFDDPDARKQLPDRGKQVMVGTHPIVMLQTRVRAQILVVHGFEPSPGTLCR